MLLNVSLLLLSVQLTADVTAVGFAGELAPQLRAAASAYLDTTVSLFLGPEVYGELFNKQQGGHINIDDEITDAIANAFELADLDHNGELTREEMGAALGKTKFLLQNDHFIKDFHYLDKDGDNRLSWQEYFRQTFSASFIEKADRGLVDVESIDGGRVEYESFYAYYKFQRFFAADSDKSDSLSPEEYLMFAKPKHYPQMRDIYYRELMADVQTDDDYEHVSLAEYKASVEASILIRRPDDLETHMDKQLQKFRDLDVNRDGRLDKNETTEWLFGSVRTDYGHLANADVRTYFRICDKDENDIIDFNEVISQSEFIYGAIDPDESNDLKNQIRKFFAEEDDPDIASHFTTEALDKLAKKEEKKNNPYQALLEEFDGVDGFDKNFFDMEHKVSAYSYDPDWDPDNIKYRWSFVKTRQTYVHRGYTLGEFVHEVKERNGYYDLV